MTYSTPDEYREEKKQEEFERELAALLNKYSKENESDTPDFILAKFLNNCLVAVNRWHPGDLLNFYGLMMKDRDKWYNKPWNRK